jgi:hypothetical protein
MLRVRDRRSNRFAHLTTFSARTAHNTANEARRATAGGKPIAHAAREAPSRFDSRNVHLPSMA